tara:strand:- start:1 stop:840 length:840 start_codon:yes stop_codon:yes gene_type:complete
MPLEGHDHDLTALAEKAQVIAEATGRCEEDVLADLLDDGKANLSAGQDAKEKDFLDIATEQAEKLKTFLTTMVPIIVLLGAVGAEGIGLLDLTDWGGDSIFDEENDMPEVLWGCTNLNALNYDATANEDDGTCEYPPDPIEGCTDDTATNYNDNATVDDDSCEYPPPRCEITLYDILLETNNSSAYLQYDLDCGSDDNAEGFNVSVQFWNTVANTTDTVNYSIGFHYIQGDVGDVQELYLHNITCNTYDFKWIAIWEDEDGNNQDLYETWSDIYMAGEN